MKRILIYTYGDQSHENTINMAVAYAAKNDAHLTGLFVKPDYTNYSNIYGEYPLNLAKTFYDRQETYSNDNKQVFDAALKKHNCTGDWHTIDIYEKNPRPELYTDCIFVSQPDPNSSLVSSETGVVDHLIISTGVPILLVPKKYSQINISTRPLLGWKESKEAAGAVRQAIPILKNAENVDIVTASSKIGSDEELIHGIQISEYLSAHGITCHFHETKILDIDRTAANAIRRHAKDNNRDLIVIGGYSHSRFREIILGGVTRELIKDSVVPVLLAH